MSGNTNGNAERLTRESRLAPPDGERLTRHSRQTDRFYVDPNLIPDGMSYEWKRLTMMGKEDSPHQVALARNHWKPVPAHRHPEISGVSKGEKGGEKPIIIDGLMLMERPAYLTEEAHDEDRQIARGQVRQQFQRLALVPKDPHMPRTPAQVSRGFERTSIPDDTAS